jgi:site-specific recombinase XerD
VRDWESQLAEPKQTEPITIKQAGENFLSDVKARSLSDCTIYKYKLLFRRIEEFARRNGLRYLKELDLQTLDQFRSGWKEGPRSSLKKLERLQAFLRFCERRKWIDTNPAIDMKAPRVPNRPTLPFTREEMLKILAALDKYAERAGVANAQRVRAFVLLLRYSGMRIGDAVQCDPERLKGSKLFLYTQKTGWRYSAFCPSLSLMKLRRRRKLVTVFSFGPASQNFIPPWGYGSKVCKRSSS